MLRLGFADHTVSNFDFQSLNLALNQELIELDLFHNGLAKVSRRNDPSSERRADCKLFISSPSPILKRLDSPLRIVTSFSSWRVSRDVTFG